MENRSSVQCVTRPSSPTTVEKQEIDQLDIGEIYFVQEVDRVDGTRSPYVKIGMVKDASRHNSEERLTDHQTGNPRNLSLYHVTKTPGPFRVERFLHQQFGPNRVKSEWFKLDDSELDAAVRIAEDMAREAFVHIPIIEEAERLGTTPSDDTKLAATAESTEWLQRLSVAKAAVKVCNELSAAYRAVATALPEELKAAAEEEELFLTEYYTTKRFDSKAFAAAHPDLAAKFTEVWTEVRGRFTAKTTDVELNEREHDLIAFRSQFTELCTKVHNGEADFGEAFEMRQVLEQYAGAYGWEHQVADAHLRAICGTASGIDNQATWNRVLKEKSGLDEDGLESQHPNEYAAFVKVTTQTRTKARRRARKKV